MKRLAMTARATSAALLLQMGTAWAQPAAVPGNGAPARSAEAADFLKAHDCAQISGPIGVRRLPSAMQVDVELTGKDGQKLILILTSDGTPAGEG